MALCDTPHIVFLFLNVLCTLNRSQSPPSNRAGTISCGQSISGTIDTFDDDPAYEFIKQSSPITFKTCNSIADTKITHLYYENGNWQSGFPWCDDQSSLSDGICNSCGAESKQEEWTVNFLNPGTYYIEIGIWDMSGDYQIQMECTSDSSTSAPTTTAQPTQSPNTVSPTMKPTTAKPITAAPTTSHPTTMVPTTLTPTSSVPTSSHPTTSFPVTAAPTSYQPTTDVPTTDAPTTNEPSGTTPRSSPPTTGSLNLSTESPTISLSTSYMHPSAPNDHQVIDTTQSLDSEELNASDSAMQSNGVVMDSFLWLLIITICCCLLVSVTTVFIVICRKKQNRNTMNMNVENNEMIKLDTVSPKMTGQTMGELTQYHIHRTPDMTHTISNNIARIKSFSLDNDEDDIDGLFTVPTHTLNSITVGNDTMTNGGTDENIDATKGNGEVYTDDNTDDLNEMYVKPTTGNNIVTKGNL